MNAAPSAQTPTGDEPNVAGVRVRPWLTFGLYLLLLASAALAMWAQRTPKAPPMITRASPFIFLAFAVGFAAYRLALVIARKYSAFKAFFQILLSALFFMMLLYPLVTQPPGSRGVQVNALLTDPDLRVRALAAEVAGYRRDEASAPALVKLLKDASPNVREAAHEALVRLNDGVDLGAFDDATAPAAWEERFP